MSARPMFAIEAVDLRRVYRRGTEEVAAVDGVSLTVGRGEFLSVVGPSGSGKTTLVNVLGCLDNPTSGRLVLDGRAVFENGRGLSEARLTRVRREGVERRWRHEQRTDPRPRRQQQTDDVAALGKPIELNSKPELSRYSAPAVYPVIRESTNFSNTN